MPLVRLIYFSHRNEDVTIDEIEKILEVSRKNNRGKNITGILCFHQNYFFQVLEGRRAAVCHLYNKIAKDPRHSNVTISDFREVPNREFSDWNMAYFPESKITTPDILAHSCDDDLNLDEMRTESIIKLILSFKERIPEAQTAGAIK
ncbi:MAG: BLUF domain-containing protein [Opitutales bacterium]